MIDGKKYKVRELNFQSGDDMNWCGCIEPFYWRFSIDKVKNESYPGKGEFVFHVIIDFNLGGGEEFKFFTLPEAKAFCQEYLEGEVMKLVEEVE